MEVLLNAKAASSIPEYDDSNYNRAKKFKAFKETKAGVKELVDSGVTKIPGFFVYAPENVEKSSAKLSDKFGRVEHRVLVGDVRSRTSVACFFHPSAANQFKPYGVIKELLSDGSLKYRGTHIAEFMEEKTAPLHSLILSWLD
ncbi:1-aminocyclopropane-1-carboxylate oxidase homolog [Populus trichocarpa]|uniref:1-aminocyclopropane-1-carboxylate oxidase homolog n=1 Tax=Populus trichocarpa TaxID=3694 RepID=UPI002277ECC5|nr:1-aminocyclopropane-1-carboxylate oxidase homolog [Populus trichocarpa]